MMINAKGVTPMPKNHLECEYSPFTHHWNCCLTYVTLDASDCTCYDDHDE